VPVVVQRHRCGRILVDQRPVPAQPVAAFDGAVHPLFAFHLQHSRSGQQADVPVQGGLGDVWQAIAQVGCGEYLPTGHGVHDTNRFCGPAPTLIFGLLTCPGEVPQLPGSGAVTESNSTRGQVFCKHHC
jgi:hypothetical protein